MSTPAGLARRLSRAVFVVLSAPLFAGQTVFQTSVAPQAVPFTTSVALPSFNPGDGFLRSVQLRWSAQVQGSFGIENLAAQSATVSGAPVAFVRAQFGIISTPADSPAFDGFAPTPLAAFDGSMDHAGTSGFTQTFPWSGGTGVPAQQMTIVSAELLESFRTSTPLTIELRAWDASHFSAPPSGQMHTFTALEVRATIEIVYSFDATGAKFCGTGLTWNSVSCPCANAGQGDNGCANSFNSAGASLDATGNARLSGDTFALQAAGMGTGMALFVQSTAFRYPAALNGDGALCFSGQLIRLGSASLAGGAGAYPSAVQQPVSVRGQINAPTARYYTAYYRNAVVFCSSGMFNATNSVAAYWEP